MAEQKDPLKITLKEAAQLYNKEVGVSKISAFDAKGKFAKYGDTPLVDIFKGEQGSRILDEMLNQTTTPGTFNKLTDNLRLITTPVRRRISSINPKNPVLNTLPALEAADEQTKIIFGERKVVDSTAETAIDTTKRKGWKEFFDKLDAIADDPKHPKQALANAFRASLYSGNRIGLMTNLQGSEYLIDQGALSVEPQTKKVGVEEKQETRTGASKKGGFRGKAIPYTVPLNENAHAYLQMQLKINQNDLEIKTFIEQEAKKGKAPVFVHKIVTGEGDKRKVKFVTGNKLTGLISDMLGEIKVSENIVVDNVSKKGYNSLFPTELKTKEQGKWGSALSRNIHASIAINELGVNQQMIDFLHGRSTTSGAALRGQTAKLGYAKRPVGTFFPSERDAQQNIGNWINEVQGKDASAIPDVENRVTSANYALKNFFNQPDIDKTPPIVEGVDSKDNFFNRVMSGEIKLDINKIRQSMKGSGKGKAGIVGAVVGTGTIAGSSDAAAEVVSVGSQMALEEILDASAIKLLQTAKFGASATPIGLGLSMAATMISPAGEGSGFEKENQYAKMIGVDRNALLKLKREMPDQYKKLDAYLQRRIFEETQLKPEQQQAKGKELRSLSDQMNMLNKGNTTTPSLLMDDGSTSINQGENYATR